MNRRKLPKRITYFFNVIVFTFIRFFLCLLGVVMIAGAQGQTRNQLLTTGNPGNKIAKERLSKKDSLYHHAVEKKSTLQYSWETEMAKATKSGDLLWMPKPFVFEYGKSIRYIDYEKGNDDNSGLTKNDPWKHHPWDPASTSNSARCKGADTYIFKKGSVYRGTITVKESGTALNPVRFTADPSWGVGDASFYGSERIVNGWKRGKLNREIPDSKNLWYRDLDFAPRTLWMVSGEKRTRIPLARMPNWKITDPEDIKSEWWFWDYKGSNKYFNVFTKSKSGKELVLGIDTKNLTGPAALYMGAIAWTEFGWVDGTPYPSYVQAFDSARRGIGFEGYLGSANSRIISRYNRYYLEDKPQFLDDPDGEFWFDKQGGGGQLYVILPDGLNPNDVVLEAGRETTLIDLEEKNHISFSGLTFKYTNVAWDLTEMPWAKDFVLKKQLYPACIRVWGGGEDLRVYNCKFSDVNSAVYMKAVKPFRHLDKIAVTDCDIRETDHTAIAIEEGIQWGNVLPDDAGHLFDVKVLRNYIYKAGQRAQRIGSADAIDVYCGETVEVAGNIIETPWHAGINVFGGKINSNIRDVPLTRLLIYQNKVVNGIRTGDDCGNIETWQGGPAYVYNNISGNPGGMRNPQWMQGKDDPEQPGSARFGMAYYLDGAFKNYYFNNIGWGLSKDPWSKAGATAMFQEIISYQNSFFNNTAFNFVKGTRRQAPQAGRDKFLGNIWDGIGDWVFWHTTPAKSPKTGNEKDAGLQKEHYALETNAFSNNIFFDITGKYASFKPSGQWNQSFEDARDVLIRSGAIASDLGLVVSTSPLNDPAQHNFSLSNGSGAIDKGVKVFVPWGLYAPVGEWNFYPAGDDPTNIIDEHWYMTQYYVMRDDYYTLPMFNLKGINIRKNDYVEGPLENWTKGALHFNGIDQYAVCADSTLDKTFDFTFDYRWDRNNEKGTRHITGKDFKSPEVYNSNFLIELYFKTEPGSKRGVIVEKMKNSGYSLAVNTKGGITFTLRNGSQQAMLESKQMINDGKWHHIIAEADRGNKLMTLYINGKKDVSGTALETGLSLENRGDLYVGGTPLGRYFNGTLDFLRICLGTLADAKTDIDELYKWEFSGPFLKDFTGSDPVGKRDAGALEKR